MDVLLAIAICVGCLIIGAVLAFSVEKKANRNPGEIDGYIVIDHDDGQFNLFSTFRQEPRDHLHDKQILTMEVMDISNRKKSNADNESKT